MMLVGAFLTALAAVILIGWAVLGLIAAIAIFDFDMWAIGIAGCLLMFFAMVCFL